jgi:hypothetical protein
MDLGVSSDFVGCDILNISLIYVAGGDVPAGDQVPQPRGSEGVMLVVVGEHRQWLAAIGTSGNGIQPSMS